MTPVGPVFPRSPFAAPVTPVAPVNPVGPVGPVAPVEPVLPVEVADPGSPVGPVDPVNPVTPRGPCDPCGPGGPAHTFGAHVVTPTPGVYRDRNALILFFLGGLIARVTPIPPPPSGPHILPLPACRRARTHQTTHRPPRHPL